MKQAVWTCAEDAGESTAVGGGANSGESQNVEYSPRSHSLKKVDF